MTARAVTIGFLGAMFIAGVGYINDRILGLENFTNGHLIPIIVLGLMFLTVIALNPLLFRVRRSWMFRPAEMAVVVVLMSAACSIPGRGLLEQFAQVLVMPFHWNRVNPGWQENKLLDYAPERALVDNTSQDEVVTGFITGAEPSRERPPLPARVRQKVARVPWGAWAPALATWLPLVLLVGLASACLALVVHKQWSSHEFLSYPIAEFTASLLEREPDQALPSILRNRLFWTGFGIIFAIRVNNALCCWHPETLIPIRLTYDFRPLGLFWPAIYKVQWGSSLLWLRVFPLVVAFAFFLSTEISLTLGLTQVFWVLFAIPMTTMGVNLSTSYGVGGWSGWQRAASYTAMALMLVYTGRQYYRDVFGRAVRIWRRETPEDANVWACRIFLVSTLLLIVLLTGLGLDLPFAAATVLLMMLTIVGVSRISAETGLFFIQPRWQPYGVLLAMFGGCAMGPRALVICGLACVVLCIDPSQALMPYLTNGLKLSEKLKLKLPTVTGITLGMYFVGVLFAVAVVLCASYDVGTPTEYNWSYQRVPTMPFRAVETEVLRLKATGLLEEAHGHWLQRLKYIQPKQYFVWSAGFGFVAVILFSFLRLRFPWWPLHPVLFLLWATYPMSFMSQSFLIGWLVKKAAVRFGGNPMVKKLKPLMVGIIAGEIAGALFCMAGGAIYYAMTGVKQVNYRFFPR